MNNFRVSPEVEALLEEISTNGFNWLDFERVFPADIWNIREGEYLAVLEAVLKALHSDEERDLLLDLLDAQWATYLERLWVMDRMSGTRRCIGLAHGVHARLALTERFGREARIGGAGMWAFEPGETLTSALVAHIQSKGRSQE